MIKQLIVLILIVLEFPFGQDEKKCNHPYGSVLILIVLEFPFGLAILARLGMLNSVLILIVLEFPFGLRGQASFVESVES